MGAAASSFVGEGIGQWITEQEKNVGTDAFDGNIRMKYRVRLVLQAGQAGLWSVTLDENRTTFPSLKTDTIAPGFVLDVLETQKGEPQKDEYGTFETGGPQSDNWDVVQKISAQFVKGGVSRQLMRAGR